jgi:phosphatidylglycerol:prolipoprotein diacylglycerol transferase
MALGLAIGRIGCFLNGCCFGGVPANPLPWAVTFPEQSPPYMRQVEEGKILLHGMAFKGTATRQVVEISDVAPDSAAEKAGLQKEDQVVEIRAQMPEEKTPRILFNATEGADDQTATTPHDLSLGAAQRALLAIKGEGTQIIINTPEKEYSWKITKADEPPPRSLPVHPTQLYSAIDAGLLCLLLLAFDPFRTRDGQVLALMLTVHPIARFLLESIRTDEPKVYPLPFAAHGVSISQLISVLIFIGAIGLWCYIFLRMPRLDGSDLPPDETETEVVEPDIPPANV